MIAPADPDLDTADARAPDAMARWVGRRLAGREPVAYLICMAYWVAFVSLPAASALVLKAVLDRIAPAGGDAVWLLLAALAGLELSRWVILAGAVFQWHGCWVFWHTLPQANMLRSLVGDPGPVDRRLPESSGEAVSRFRDDTFHLAWMLDVWLDVIAASLAALGAVVVMGFVDLRLTLVVCLPVVVALWLCQWLGHRLRAWRRREREATAAVTGYIGDVFGAISTIKLAGARRAIARRFAALGDERADAARIDQVAGQTLQTVSAAVGDLGMGFVVLMLIPALASGDATVGDVGLFMASVSVVAGLPRWAARYGAITRQASVSVERLAELFPQPEPARIVSAHPVPLRAGPGDLIPTTADSGPEHRLERLDVRGLTVRRAGLHDVDLIVERGSLTVVTGPVGSGKSTLLRAVLGLVARDAGEIGWNGELVHDPSTVMVPPRAAYVAQTPRLFSEPLADAILLGVDRSRVDSAVRLACLEDEVAWMPEGLATVVGARGVRLSGGQVQRTATARALVRQPELLVIDDVSSALDVGTEAQLWRGLLDDGGGAGVGALLVVSHRPAVLARADQVLELVRTRR
ncbi:MAG: ATP-binding cassette domain-containing protein [Acidimicrobiales bacterium]